MIKITKKLMISIIAGILLGIVCVIGASIRFGDDISSYMIFALWFNRLLMGIVIGAPWEEVNLPKSLMRGAFLGLIVSFAYFASIGFSDIVSFLVGAVYGIIIEYLIFKMTSRTNKKKQ